MRIAEISTLLRPVPPKGEGSVESLVATLCEGLVARGHAVTLFATADSKTSGRLCSPVEESYMTDSKKWDWQLYEAFQVREAFRNWRDFDLIHCHSYYFGLLFADRVPIPSLHSVHIDPGPDYAFLAQRTWKCHLHIASHFQRREFGNSERVHVIPHGIDVDRFQVCPGKDKENYLAFLGRFIPEKGPLEAIQVAETAGVPLRMAAPENDYFRQHIRDRLRPGVIDYVGEVREAAKVDFLKKARALLYPVKRGEPFGLVLLEAMACGVPVVAFRRGAVPELVRHGVTGYLGSTIEELAQGIPPTGELDPQTIRNHVKEHFNHQLMVERMESLMRQIIHQGSGAGSHGASS